MPFPLCAGVLVALANGLEESRGLSRTSRNSRTPLPFPGSFYLQFQNVNVRQRVTANSVCRPTVLVQLDGRQAGQQ